MVTRPFDPDDDFPFDEPPEAPRGTEPPEPPRPPAGAGPGPAPGARAGEDAEDHGREAWERVREAAWRVGQRARRHERVLHTRISRELARDLRRAADDLRVPVSNLVRNVLEETFGAVERVSDEVGGFLEEVLADTDAARDDLRQLRRRVRRLARSGRRRSRRALRGDEEALADVLDDSDQAFAEPGAPASAAAATDAAAGPAERSWAGLRDAGVFRPRGAELPFPEVLGWQPLRLNASAPCACGERQLAAGEEAFVAVTERGLSRTFLCRTCMSARSAT